MTSRLLSLVVTLPLCRPSLILTINSHCHEIWLSGLSGLSPVNSEMKVIMIRLKPMRMPQFLCHPHMSSSARISDDWPRVTQLQRWRVTEWGLRSGARSASSHYCQTQFINCHVSILELCLCLDLAYLVAIVRSIWITMRWKLPRKV